MTEGEVPVGELPSDDLRQPVLPGEHVAEYIVRVRGLNLQSANPADRMPNTAFITLGPQEVSR